MTNIRLRLIVIAISLGVFASSMSTTMLFIAYPEIVTYFDIDYEILQWRNILFWSFFGVFMPFFGVLSSMVNIKKLFLSGLCIFIVSCFISAFSENWELFLLGQALQGFADAMIVPVQAVLIRKTFSKEKIGWAFGLQGAVMAASALIGPALGGLIIQSTDWRIIFWVLATLGIVALLLGMTLLPNIKDSVVLNISKLPILSTTILLITIISGQVIFIEENFVWQLICIFSLIGFIYIEFIQNKYPRVIPTEIWKNTSFLINLVRGFCIFLSLNGLATFTPIYFRMIQGYQAGIVGVLLLISPIVMLSLGEWGGRQVDKSQFKSMNFGLLLLLGYCAGFIFPGEESYSIYYFALFFVIGGIGAVMILPAQNKIAVTSSPENETGRYMGIFQMVQFITAGVAGVIFAPLIQKETNSEVSALGYQILASSSVILLLISIGILLIEKRISNSQKVEV